MRSATSGGKPPVATGPQLVGVIRISDLPWSAIACVYWFPVRVLAGDGTVVVDERRGGLGHVEHLGRAVHLHPGPAEVVGEDADAHLGVAARIPRLRPLRVGRHHDAPLGVHPAAHWGELRPPVATCGHVDPLVSGTQEVEELFAGDGVGGGYLDHAAMLTPRVGLLTW